MKCDLVMFSKSPRGNYEFISVGLTKSITHFDISHIFILYSELDCVNFLCFDCKDHIIWAYYKLGFGHYNYVVVTVGYIYSPVL